MFPVNEEKEKKEKRTRRRRRRRRTSQLQYSLLQQCSRVVVVEEGNCFQ